MTNRVSSKRTVSDAYLLFAEGRARGFLDRLSGKDHSRLKAGENLEDAVQKWLIQQLIFQHDPQIAHQAAAEYRDFRRMQENARKNRSRAKLPRRTDDVRDIERIWASNFDLTWKEVERRVNEMRAKEGKPKIAEVGAKDRILNTRVRLREEAAQFAAMRQVDEQDMREFDSH